MTTIEREFVLDPVRCRESSYLMAGIAGSPPASSEALPPLWHWLFSHETPLDALIGRDGHPSVRPHGVPDSYARRMWAGSVIQFRAEPKMGQRLKMEVKTGSAVLKEGRTGPLAFVPTILTISSGELIILEEMRTGVYCPPRMQSTNAPFSPHTDAYAASRPDTVVISFSEIDLFRYSSLLKVFHRIHYDARFARYQEGHHDLVVHGPLLAQALIMRVMELYPAHGVSNLRVMVLRPTYVNCDIHLAVDRESESGEIRATAFSEELHPAMIVTMKLAPLELG